MEKTKKSDFVEIIFTGYTNGEPFDSNVPEELKKINPKAKPEKTVIVIGEAMVVPGLDKALENKELNKEYEVSFSHKEGFGERKRELIKTIPLASFTEQKVNPQPGMVLALDNNLVKILTVSGARVTADFNNPLAGKDLKYKFTITRLVKEDKEKAETLFQTFFRFVPEFEVKEKEVVIKGPEVMSAVVDHFGEKFKGLMGKDLKFELKKEEKKDELKKEHKEEKKKDSTQDKPTETTSTAHTTQPPKLDSTP